MYAESNVGLYFVGQHSQNRTFVERGLMFPGRCQPVSNSLLQNIGHLQHTHSIGHFVQYISVMVSVAGSCGHSITNLSNDHSEYEHAEKPRERSVHSFEVIGWFGHAARYRSGRSECKVKASQVRGALVVVCPRGRTESQVPRSQVVDARAHVNDVQLVYQRVDYAKDVRPCSHRIEAEEEFPKTIDSYYSVDAKHSLHRNNLMILAKVNR